MKKIGMMLILLSVNAFAADLNLNGGESAVIQANVRTQVTCGGSSSGSNSCESATEGLKLLIESCRENSGASYCIDKYWSSFKKDNPSCVMSAIGVCISYCKVSSSGSYCADKCSSK